MEMAQIHFSGREPRIDRVLKVLSFPMSTESMYIVYTNNS